ncbi:hypothetical protein BCR43DRAFT_551550 [Syncephalastrum racemosum]|uniref:Cyclase-domain-containing protein n=1 Tax=Syncephalastrum racemosum TaxID=13706 RepID=A0A1X2H5V0_SYNRA|nr:hypothetical protein BCR43DRAFT_551550 [Syncephalastrum racemosum]
MTGLPRYHDLPIDPKYPPKTAWGVWGEDDNLGTLNLLTEERVLKAAQTVKTGKVFPLNWDLEKPDPPFFRRSAIKHHIQDHPGSDARKFDDVYDNFNTQASSQWDGLRHVCHFRSGRFYNNVSSDHILPGPNASDRLGIHHMARRGIVGRAVLLDYGRWRSARDSDYNPLVREEVPVEDLEQVAKAQGVTFEDGDILLIRYGWMESYENSSCAIRSDELGRPDSIGIEASEKTFGWIWDHHFACVGADVVAFEAFPVKDWDLSCHAQLLGGFGMPIGEMFYLEDLANDCAQDDISWQIRNTYDSPDNFCLKLP